MDATEQKAIKAVPNTTSNKRGPSKVAVQEMEARRKLEEKLEKLRLERELSEFDFG